MLRITFHCLLVSALLGFAPGCGDEDKTPVCSSDNANSLSIGMACTKGGEECTALSLLCDADFMPDGMGDALNMCTKMCNLDDDCGEGAVCQSMSNSPQLCWLAACVSGD